MPVVEIPLQYLRRFYKEDRSTDELIAIFHEMGCSVDGIESVQRLICKGCGETIEYVAPLVPAKCESCAREFKSAQADYENGAPADVVQKERDSLKDLQDQLTAAREVLERLENR